MRPIRLEIEGFTSFKKKVEVDFSGMTLFTINGPTGAGKTSLIDAMIYALYGRTPRIGSGLSDLISQGSDRLSVLLEFSSSGRRYRMARLIKRGKKTQTSDVRLEEWQDDKWVSRADKAKEANTLIEKTVGLDFDGFTKSVVLPQGKFDEFLRGDVTQRRKILSDLLQLDVYDRMKKQANDLAQKHNDEVEHLQKQLAIDFADANPQRLAELQQEYNTFEAECNRIEAELERLRGLMPDALRLRQCRSERSKKQADLALISPKLVQFEDEVSAARAAIENSTKTIQSLEADIESSAYDPETYARLTALAQRAQQLSDLKQRVAAMAASEQKSKETLEIAESLLKTALADQEAAAAILQGARDALEKHRGESDAALKKYGSPDAIAALIEANERRIKAEDKKASLDEQLALHAASQKSKLRDIGSIGKQLEAAQAALSAEIEARETLHREHAAAELRLSVKVGELCPVCQQKVSKMPVAQAHPSLEAAKLAVESRQVLIEGLKGNKIRTEEGLLSLQQMMDAVELQINDLGTTVDEISAKIRAVLSKEPGPDSGEQLLGLRSLVTDLQSKCQQAAQLAESRAQEERSARDRASKLDSELAAAKATLEQLSLNLEGRRAECEAQKLELGDYADLTRVNKELEEQIKEKQKKDGLDEALRRERKLLAESNDKLARQSQAIAELKSRSKTLTEESERLAAEVDNLSRSLAAALPDLDVAAEGIGDPAAQLEQKQRQLQASCNEARASAAQRQAQISVVEQKIKRAEEIRSEIESHGQEAAVARELGLLLRADHFIAYIQQEAYQRLATEGSAHFKMLSSDRYSFGFDKDEFVALDHWNADEPRPVTTLSGGESFLASLALALALAEGLSGLSHSKGRAALESLFLDEGFGMLDNETLDVVLSGLETLTASDRMVGIVSHIPELAERIPSQIQVAKAPGGSTISKLA
ncbi:MAG TPA: SMC family ATPase [Blastocatellia bacterium]|nr:SMC family ATPase [Blastocatellia bacterium]